MGRPSPQGRKNRPAFDVIGVGLNAVDHLCVVPAFPAYGSKIAAQEHHVLPGGQIATALVALSKWGRRTKYIGSFGDDDAGRLGLESLNKAGVDTKDAFVVRSAETQMAFIVIDRGRAERTIVWHRDPALRIDAGRMRPELIRSCRLLHLDAHDIDASIAAARIASETGVPVTLDMDSAGDGALDLIRLVNYPVLSEEVPKAITGKRENEPALHDLASQTGRFLCMTIGAAGALAIEGGRILQARGFEVDAVDTTGAGDIFHAGFAHGLLEGWPIEDVLDFANAAAALNCTQLGARSGIASIDEIEALRARGRRSGEGALSD